jgi:hypothetical protein
MASAAQAADQTFPGQLKQEIWNGKVRADIENGTAGPATTTKALDSFFQGDFADNYAERISGYFIPAVSGNYVFFISSDDDSDLFLSPDANPANKRLIAQETIYSNARQWTTTAGGSNLDQKRSDKFKPAGETTAPFAAGIPLVAGQKYYIEGVHHEGGGGDNFGATYKLVEEEDPLEGSDPLFIGDNIAYSVKIPTSTVATVTPDTQTATIGTRATFTVAVQTDTDVFPNLQWRRNGVLIPGATAYSYSTIVGLGDENAEYDVAISFPFIDNTATSSSATLHVQNGITLAGLKEEVFAGGSRLSVESGEVNTPAAVHIWSSFDSPVNIADNFTRRVSGWFTPAVTGDYVFFISSDDDSDLFLSTDENPANKKLIAQETAWSNSREWVVSSGGSDNNQKRSDYWMDAEFNQPYASGIHLVSGQKYYIEGVQHEGAGGDNFGATFKLIEEADPINGDPSTLTGELVSYSTLPTTSLAITTQPQATTVNEGLNTSFSVATTSDSEITPNYQWRKNGVDIAGANSSTYSLVNVSSTQNNDVYDVVVTIPQFNQTVTSSPAKLTVISSAFTTGFLKREYFDQKVRADVENGTAGDPTTITFIQGFEAPEGVDDDYAQRVSGLFIPAVTGSYVFFIASDDDSDLFLSTDENPANKKLIAQETAWSDTREWTTSAGSSDVSAKRSDTFINSAWETPNQIDLEAGKRYYIEGVHHEGGGGDRLAATFKLVEEEDPANGAAVALSGSVVGSLVPSPSILEFTRQPASSTVIAGSSVTLSADINTDSYVAPAYQWRRNGQPIAGATGRSFNFVPTSADAGATYDLVVNIPGFQNTITSDPATFTVSAGSGITTGSIRRETFTGGTRGANGFVFNADNKTETLATTMEGPLDVADNYTDRFSGFFLPPATGDYVFFISADDDSDLFLSTDEDPAHKQIIAQQTGWSGYRAWNTDGDGTDNSGVFRRRSDQWQNAQGETPFANGIHMEAGKAYYIEGVHHEGAGGDNFSVYFKTVDQADPVDGDPANLTGAVIGYKAEAAATAPKLTVTRNGNDLSVSWTPTGGVLQSTTELKGAATVWTEVGSANPATVQINASGNLFLRVQQ